MVMRSPVVAEMATDGVSVAVPGEGQEYVQITAAVVPSKAYSMHCPLQTYTMLPVESTVGVPSRYWGFGGLGVVGADHTNTISPVEVTAARYMHTGKYATTLPGLFD